MILSEKFGFLNLNRKMIIIAGGVGTLLITIILTSFFVFAARDEDSVQTSQAIETDSNLSATPSTNPQINTSQNTLVSPTQGAGVYIPPTKFLSPVPTVFQNTNPQSGNSNTIQTAPTSTPAPTTPPTQVTQVADLYVSPVSQTLVVGGQISVAVRLNTNGQSVNAVDVRMNYPTAFLEVVNISNDGSAFGIPAETSGSGGTIKITKGSIAPVNGDSLIATVVFRATASGNAQVTFSGESKVVSSSTNNNILRNTTGGSYTIQ